MRELRVFQVAVVALLALIVVVVPTTNVEAVTAGDVLTILNDTRSNNGLHTLSMNSQLVAAAQAHSNDMAAGDFLSHTGSNGSSPGDRISATGYGWSTYGENVLYRFDASASGAFNQWWNSEPHRNNMMSANFCDVGIAYTVAGNGRHYYTMVLAKKFGQNCSSGSAGGGGTTYTPPTTTDPGAGSLAGSENVTTGGATTFVDGRVNPTDYAPPVTAYCDGNDGIDVYGINPLSEGYLAFSVSGTQVANGLNQAVASGQNQTLGSSGPLSLYALSSNQLQLNGFMLSGELYEYIFPSDFCGAVNLNTTTTTTTTTTTPTTTANTPTTTTTTTSGQPNFTFANGQCTHQIQLGENLFRIALRYGTTFSQLAALNGITDPTRIFAGDIIVVPCP